MVSIAHGYLSFFALKNYILPIIIGTLAPRVIAPGHANNAKSKATANGQSDNKLMFYCERSIAASFSWTIYCRFFLRSIVVLYNAHVPISARETARARIRIRFSQEIV